MRRAILQLQPTPGFSLVSPTPNTAQASESHPDDSAQCSFKGEQPPTTFSLRPKERLNNPSPISPHVLTKKNPPQKARGPYPRLVLDGLPPPPQTTPPIEAVCPKNLGPFGGANPKMKTRCGSCAGLRSGAVARSSPSCAPSDEHIPLGLWMVCVSFVRVGSWLWLVGGVGGLVGWLVGWLAGWLVGWSGG